MSGAKKMGEVISIKQYKDNGYSLTINPEMAIGLGFDKRYIGHIILSYGTQKCYTDIIVSPDVMQDEIYLSRKVIDYLHIPEYPYFEIRAACNEVMIGPHIGILLKKKDEEITADRLRGALKFVSRYSALNGSVIVFALNKVDRASRLIEGYCYNPSLKNWEWGIFPYPLSIYLWASPDRNWKNHFLSAIGNTIFNNFYLDKYQLYSNLSTDTNMNEYLPKTILYNSIQDAFDMLYSYGKIVVKPVTGFHGIGVNSIHYDAGKFTVRYRKDDRNMEEFFADKKELSNYFDTFFIPGEYIVQQHIDLLTYENGVIDFRLVMQKDIHGKWICKTIVGRLGDKGSIISNLSSGARAMAALSLFKDVQYMHKEQAEKLEETIRETGLKICYALSNLGINYGNLGLDIGIDKDMHPWLIEVNSRRPDPTIAMDIGDKELYHDICSGPLFYAKFLAGFEPEI